MASPRERPLFVWDGECEFCRFWVVRWKRRVGDRVEVAPYQEVQDQFPGIPEESFRRSAKLVEPDGEVRHAAASALRLLSFGPGPGLLWGLYRRVPPFRWAAEAVYRFVADRRPLAGRWTRRLWGDEPGPHGFGISAWLFQRALAAVYLIAFLSLLVQVAGLVGPGGILPVGRYLEAVGESTGGPLAAAWRAPTLAWLAPSGAFLQGMAAAGAAASVVLFLGFLPLAAGGLAWVLYLSLVVAGQDFLAYQWDLLLLEAGFLSLFLLPLRGLRPGRARRGAPGEGSSGRAGGGSAGLRRPWFPAVFLSWWLLFRLTLESGIVKLASGDPVWRDLTAMAHHYETQPIPNPVSWFAHQLPLWFDRLSTLGTLAVELGVPFLFFLPRRPRFLAAGAVIAHQALIFLTGNYTFFNVLTAALALMLFDDAFWRGTLGKLAPGRALLRRLCGGEEGAASAGAPAPRGARQGPGRLRRAAAGLFLAFALVAGAGQVVGSARPGLVPGPVSDLSSAVSPLRILNGYGLFADMTVRRPEIVLEGRGEGGPWRPLEFEYKPDDLREIPPQVAPHQPRLDWQMWFAALRAGRAPSRVRYDRWFLRFAAALLRGRPEVWGLLDEEGPFGPGPQGSAEGPPDALRARLYEYRFASPEARAESGRWWARRFLETYLPPVRLTPRGLRTAGRGARGEPAVQGERASAVPYFGKKVSPVALGAPRRR